jgi:parallel beta-helix repeat protein
MNDVIRQKFSKLIAQQGRPLLNNPERCESLLKSTYGEYRREIFVLVNALREQVVVDLLKPQTSMSRKLLLDSLTKRLQDNLAFTEEASRWAVWTWALTVETILSAERDKGSSGSSAVKIPSTGSVGPEQIGVSDLPVLIVSQEGDGPFQTINEAIRNALPRTRILIRPGHYKESIVLDKLLEISADGPTEQVIVESIDTTCIRMETDYAVVRGLTLKCQARQHSKKCYGVDIPRGRLLLEDCDITSSVLACVAIHGPTASPIIRRCKIHDGKAGGIVVWDKGQGILEDCDIFGNTFAGVEIRQEGNPTLRRCSIHDGKTGGVFVWDNGRGVLEECDIFSNAKAASDEGDILSSARAGVGISADGNPLIRRCTIRDGLTSGLLIWDNGKGTIENCDIFGNARAGIEIYGAGNPVIRQCRINRNASVGVWVYKKGAGVIENCDITGNLRGVWDIAPWCQVQRSGNKE